MPAATKRKKTTKAPAAVAGSEKLIMLNTQDKRSTFVRREMRKQGLTVSDLADMTGHCRETVFNYSQHVTRNPLTETTRGIFHALGYDLLFRARVSKGTVAL
jgi:hypothetical protein